jgi:hypothetical protein
MGRTLWPKLLAFTIAFLMISTPLLAEASHDTRMQVRENERMTAIEKSMVAWLSR